MLCANFVFRQSQFERREQNDFSLNRISIPFLNWRIYVLLSIFSHLTYVCVCQCTIHTVYNVCNVHSSPAERHMKCKRFAAHCSACADFWCAVSLFFNGCHATIEIYAHKYMHTGVHMHSFWKKHGDNLAKKNHEQQRNAKCDFVAEAMWRCINSLKETRKHLKDTFASRIQYGFINWIFRRRCSYVCAALSLC